MGYNHVISLGLQCSSARAIESAGVRTASFPYDWIFTNVPYLRRNFTTLIEKGAEAAWREHCFFPIVRMEMPTWEHFKSLPPDGKEGWGSPTNVDAGVTFPHDHDDILKPEWQDTMLRRFTRMYTALHTLEESILFVYTSPVNPNVHFSIDGDILSDPMYQDFVEFSEIIQTVRPADTFSILIIDALKMEVPEVNDPTITVVQIEEAGNWTAATHRCGEIVKAHFNAR